MVSTSAKVVMVSAIASGQGKTTTTAALARKLVKLGKTVRIFKTGPDFIDPMILERACGSPVYSLDLWMVGHAASQAMLAEAAQSADVILIEGVMGLYDGNPSSADLARAFGVPVLAVLDASAMAQTVGALALGLRDFGPVNLAGVIANRVASEGHAKMVAEAMRDIPLLGSLMRQEQVLPERHLGWYCHKKCPTSIRCWIAWLTNYRSTWMPGVRCRKHRLTAMLIHLSMQLNQQSLCKVKKLPSPATRLLHFYIQPICVVYKILALNLFIFRR